MCGKFHSLKINTPTIAWDFNAFIFEFRVIYSTNIFASINIQLNANKRVLLIKQPRICSIFSKPPAITSIDQKFPTFDKVMGVLCYDTCCCCLLVAAWRGWIASRRCGWMCSLWNLSGVMMGYYSVNDFKIKVVLQIRKDFHTNFSYQGI